MKEPMRKDIDGKVYIIHEMPCLASYEILMQIPLVVPSTDFSLKSDLLHKMMKYVSVDIEGREQPLITSELINNHVKDVKTLMLLQKEVLQYSNDFFADGKISTFLGLMTDFAEKEITRILVRLLDAYLNQEKQA